jgi:hypothetical protein
VLYELYGTIVHYGRTMFSGHYVSFIKSNGLWHLFDDDQVTPHRTAPHAPHTPRANTTRARACVVGVQVVEVNNAIVLKQNAYMLFFQRVYTPEQMARQEQQLLQLPQQLSLPQESQQQQQQPQSKSQRRRNNKKKNEANNAQQPQTQPQPQPQTTAAPAVATEEAKAGPPPEWKLPKYGVFYSEEESGEESWIKDLLLVAEVPAEVPTHHTTATRQCFGELTLCVSCRVVRVVRVVRWFVKDKGRVKALALVGGVERPPDPPR